MAMKIVVEEPSKPLVLHEYCKATFVLLDLDSDDRESLADGYTVWKGDTAIYLEADQ